jgi:hypothetical protein
MSSDQASGRLLRGVAEMCFEVGRRVESAAGRLERRLSPPTTYPDNARFRDLHRGRRAFVIGNGPSLAKQDVSVLQGELVFTMNSFDRHPASRLLLPVYHCLADPELNDNTAEREVFLDRIANGIGDESQVFTPAWTDMHAGAYARWRASGQLHLVPLVGDIAKDPVTSLDMCVGIPGVWSVAQMAIMIAAYMGCSPIYLIGLDSDWAASLDRDRHFYEERELDESWAWAYENILEETLFMFRGYRHLWEYLRRRGVDVYNCTEGGLLDVFPRKRFEDVTTAG